MSDRDRDDHRTLVEHALCLQITQLTTQRDDALHHVQRLARERDGLGRALDAEKVNFLGKQGDPRVPQRATERDKQFDLERELEETRQVAEARDVMMAVLSSYVPGFEGVMNGPKAWTISVVEEIKRRAARRLA